VAIETPLAKLDREAMDRLTDTMTDAEISALYGYSRTAATYCRKRLGVLSWSEKNGRRRYRESYEVKPGQQRVFSHRKSGADERYFQSISSPEKAYWLGFFLADAWIVTEKGQPTAYAIALHERDREALEHLQEQLRGSSMIRRTRIGSPLLQIKFTSAVAAQDLIAKGITPRKSKTARLPDLEASLMPHLLRGYFDGDGSISVRQNALTMDFTSGSKQLLQDIDAHLRAAIAITPTVNTDRNSFKLRIYAANAIRFGEYLYGCPPHEHFSLTRKREKFLGYLGSGAGHSWKQLLSDLDSASSR